MVEQIFDLGALLFVAAFALVAFVAGAMYGAVKSNNKAVSWMRGLEAAILALAGGFLARTFVTVLLHVADNSSGAGLAVGWGFFLWHGAVDTFAKLGDARPLTTTAALQWTAATVGCFVGMWDGLWRIHRWKGPGLLAFLLDITWGLAGSLNGCLFHIVNFLWANHKDTPRNGAHIYESGFRFKTGFAVTQGAVMSNMGTNGPTSDLFKHEKTHVWQNRAFGPLFTLTYLGWMVVFFIPGLIAGAVKYKSFTGAFQGVEQWCYFNNPWEAWAYKVGCGPRYPNRGPLVWSDRAVSAAASLFFLGVILLFGLIVLKVWVG